MRHPALHMHATATPQDTPPFPPGAHRFCDPSNIPMLHAGRCVPAEQSRPSYLVLGMFKTSAEHPGFPDTCWLTLSDMKASEDLTIEQIKTKLGEFEMAATAKRNEILDAPAPAAADN